MEISIAKRVFTIGSRELSDPDPRMTPLEVIDHYSKLHPELTTAVIEGQKVDKEGNVHYTLKTVISDKG